MSFQHPQEAQDMHNSFDMYHDHKLHASHLILTFFAGLLNSMNRKLTLLDSNIAQFANTV